MSRRLIQIAPDWEGKPGSPEQPHIPAADSPRGQAVCRACGAPDCLPTHQDAPADCPAALELLERRCKAARRCP